MTKATQEDRYAPGANVRVPPPLLFASMILLDAGLRRVVDGAIPVPRSVALPLGIGLAVAGAAIMLWAGGLFRFSGQDPRPWLNTPELIVKGVYRFTRNPMYVGMALVQAGFGFAFDSPWLLALLPISLVLVYLTAIRHEEVYLEAKFQDSYRNYKQRVRRWL